MIPDAGYPSFGYAVHSFPVGPAALAAPLERFIPESDYLVTERRDSIDVAGHSVVRGMPTYHGCDPAALFGDGQVTASFELDVQSFQFRSYPFRDCDPQNLKSSVPSFPADMREP